MAIVPKLVGRGSLAAVLAMATWGSANATAPVLASRYAQFAPGESLQFALTAGDAGDVSWQVDNVEGGNSTTGTISADGRYVAPASPPASGSVTITALSRQHPEARATAVVTLISGTSPGRTYVVATTGKDTNPGTPAAPFRTIQHAADLVQPGDTVLVRQGVYKEIVTIKRSGSAVGGYVTISSYPGELATLDGTGKAVPGGQWGLVTLQNASWVVVQGFELRNFKTASISAVPIGLYVTGAGKNVQIVNNHIHAIATTAATTPSACASDAFGLTVNGTATAPISGLVISGNEIDHLKTGCSETLSLNGNVDGFVIAGNVIHDDDNIGIGAIGFEKTAPDPSLDQARNGVIRGNIVYNITSYNNPDYGRQYAADGIYVDGGTSIVIEQNLVQNVDLGIELASEHKGRTTSNVIARNNVLYANNSAAISIGGYGPGRGGSQGCTIVNNTLYADDTKNTGSGEFQIQYNATGNLFTNNIVQAGRRSVFLYGFTLDAQAPATLDRNLYFASSGSAKSQWEWQRKSYVGFTKYQAGSGQDAHSLFADPMFRAPASSLPDLDVAAGSPAFGFGQPLGAAILGAADFAGAPRPSGGSVTAGAFQN